MKGPTVSIDVDDKQADAALQAIDADSKQIAIALQAIIAQLQAQNVALASIAASVKQLADASLGKNIVGVVVDPGTEKNH